MKKAYTLSTILEPRNLAMSKNISAYEPLLDQCEAVSGQTEELAGLDCCHIQQLVTDIVPANWETADYELASVSELVDALLIHHSLANGSINRISALFELVLKTHGESYPDLEYLSVLFNFLANELQPLMLREERVVFPLAVRLEKAAEFGLNSLLSPFASLQNPLRTTAAAREIFRNLFNDLRLAMSNFDLPINACAGHSLLYAAVRALHRNIEDHFQLEQKLLYSRAFKMEATINRHG